jgi:glycine betaine/proline transport system ATP-binding protein
MSKVQLQHVWKIFGPNPRYVLRTMNNAASSEQVLRETGHVAAVRDVSLSVAQGEIFVVMGLSGSGKSTLIRCLSRPDRADSRPNPHQPGRRDKNE